MDVALNNLQRLICHKTQPTNQPTNRYFYLILIICKQIYLAHKWNANRYYYCQRLESAYSKLHRQAIQKKKNNNKKQKQYIF